MSTPSSILRVLVADDHAMLRAGLVGILTSQSDIEVIGEAADGERAIALVRAERPDVALMDIRMPRIDGIEAARRLADTSTRILMLTTFDIDKYVYAALKAGASGFLLKDTAPEALIAAVRAVGSGESLLAPTVTRRLIEEYVRRPAPGVLADGMLQPLTPREREVVAEVGRGRSNAEIAARLVLSEATVKTHLARSMSKLRLRDRAQVVVLAYESGLVRPGEGHR